MNLLDTITKVAGVTYEGRQELLKSLQDVCEWRIMDLIRTQYAGQPAIQVRDRVTGAIVGWIPKSDIDKVIQMNLSTMTGWIGHYHGIYYCQLFETVPPTYEQYQEAEGIYQMIGKPFPGFDMRACIFAIEVYHNRAYSYYV